MDLGGVGVDRFGDSRGNLLKIKFSLLMKSAVRRRRGMLTAAAADTPHRRVPPEAATIRAPNQM